MNTKRQNDLEMSEEEIRDHAENAAAPWWPAWLVVAIAGAVLVGMIWGLIR